MATGTDVQVIDACCVPSDRPVLTAAHANRLAGLLKAVADPARLRLLSLVAGADGGEICICDLTAPVGLSQPTVSHHMRVLVEAGLLTRDQRGKWAYYRLVDGAVEALSDAMLAPLRVGGLRPTSPRGSLPLDSLHLGSQRS